MISNLESYWFVPLFRMMYTGSPHFPLISFMHLDQLMEYLLDCACTFTRGKFHTNGAITAFSSMTSVYDHMLST